MKESRRVIYHLLSLDSQIEKYKELKETLDKGNLSTEESRSIKEQLLEIQQSLIESYGEEASNIDLANGKYREQLGLLSELSKDKATDYVTENRDVFADAKEALEKIETYNIGEIMHWNGSSDAISEQNKALYDYIETYSELLKLDTNHMSSHGYTSSYVTLAVKADVASADELMHQFAEDLEKYGDENDIDVSKILEGISEQLKKTWTDELTEYKTVYDEFMKAEIVRNDALRPLYQQSIQAVEDYNNALSTGEGIEEARANLDSVQQSVQNATDELEGSQDVFDAIYDGINKNAEAAYNLGQEFANDKTVQEYAEQLRGLSDIDLKAINFDNDNTEKGEEAFRGLMGTLGLTKEQVQNLIDKLVELGYVQGKGSTFDEDPPTSFEGAWADFFTSKNDSVKELGDNLLDLAKQGRLTKETFNEVDSTAGNYFKNLGISADEAVSKINKLVDESEQLSSMSSQISSMSDALSTKKEDGFVSADTLSGFDAEVRGLDSWNRFQEVLGSTTSSYKECQEAANALATEWVDSTDFLAQLTDENKEYYETQLEAMGVENYEEIISYAQSLNEAKEVLAESSLVLGETTQDEIEALIAEGQYSELTANMILALYDAKIAEQAVGIDTAADCENLIALAGDTGRTSQCVQLLIQLMGIYNNLESGAYNGNRLLREEALAEVDRIKGELETLANGEGEEAIIEPTVKLGNKGKSSAKSAGSEAADAYLEAFEDELADLEDLRDRGTIDESTYLKRLRALYQRYFKDRKEYIDEYNKYERQYLEGMKSLYESALSGITKLLSNKIDGYSDAKESAVKALEAEKQAAEDAYQAQIDAIDDVIDSKQDIIDGIQNEIDAMRDANEERQREIDLEKAKYELERLQNQKTNFVYRSGEGFLYENDPSAVRDAKQSVEDAELEIKIAAKEKEIDLIEKEIDALEKQKDAIQKLMDESSKYYENMISQTEAYWDSIINSLEQQKSKWEELAEIESVAEAYSAIEQVFGDLGYTVEDVLNGSSGAFEDFRSKYIELLSDLNSNDSFANGLSYAAGVVEENLGSFTDKAKEIADSISDLGNAGSDLESLSSSMENIGTSSTIAAEGTKGTASGMSELSASASDASESLNSISTILDEISGADNILDLAGAFERLAGALGTVNKALGIGEGETTEGGLAGTLAKLTQLSIEGDPSGNGSGGLSEQFQKLKSSIAAVSSALTGSGAGSDSDSPGESEGAGGGSSLTTALETLKTTADAVLGNGIGEAADSDGETAGSGNGLIGQFSQVKENVMAISTAIGTEESGDKKEGNLIGSLSALDEKSNEILGEPGGEGVIGDFEKMQEPLKDANEHVAGIAESLAEIDGQKVECTITVHMETTGNTSAAYFLGTAGSHMNLKSTSYTASKGPADVNGTAFATGNWAVQSSGYRALVGELGYEIIVRNGRFFTVGNTGAEFVPIQRGDIVFNHEQSRQLLKYGHISGRGKAYADGAVGNPLASGKYVPLPVNHPEMELSRTLQAYIEKIGGSIRNIVAPSVNSIQKDMTRMVNHVQNVNNNSRCDQPLTVQIGDIHLHEVQNTDGLAKAIVSRLPAMVMQEIHKR
ncbi:MAG: hypothetical protein Q4C58_14185 [Eubacteriales bacterium]|nr:hypothetical protein [Eubacteriales bacterium]